MINGPGFDLTGKRALITGASSGFGAHFAKLLANQGADLILAARRLDKLEEVAQPLRAMGRHVETLSMDVSQPSSVSAAFAQLPAPADIIINNSGIGQSSWLVEMDEEEWQALQETNLSGVWRVAKAGISQLRAAGRPGVVVNISSITAMRTALKSGAYAVTKAAVDHLTRALAVEVARHGIRVNALAPGYFETDLNAAFLTSPSGQKMAERVPMRRFGTLDELNLPLLTLISDQCSYLTGATLVVDGGHSVNSL